MYDDIIVEKEGVSLKVKRDWTCAYLFDKCQKKTNACFVILAYGQQAILIFLGFLALFQIIIHAIVFWFFKKLFESKKLCLELDYNSRLHEYGLEHWNHVLNNIYWMLSVVIVIPILSKEYNPTSDVGQRLIKMLFPLILLTPMFLTIISRQNKLPEVWERVKRDDRVEMVENVYNKQLLWPIDRNWASKAGIVLSFLLLSYLLGTEIFSFVK